MLKEALRVLKPGKTMFFIKKSINYFGDLFKLLFLFLFFLFLSGSPAIFSVWGK